MAIIIIAIIGLVVAIRAISPEDTWLCQKGEWIAHGHPSAPKPTSSCPVL